jgi:hypothetical protein
MSEVDSIDLLSAVDLPYCKSQVLDDLFLRSILSMLESHFRAFPWLAKIYEESSGAVASLGERSDLSQLPFLHFRALANLGVVQMASPPSADGLAGSGVAGGDDHINRAIAEKTAVRLDNMMRNSLKQLRVTQRKITNQIYIRARGNPRNAFMKSEICRQLGSGSETEVMTIEFATASQSGSLAFAKEMEKKIDRLIAEGLPVTIICRGEAALDFIDIVAALGRKFSLPAGSTFLTRGLHLHGDNFSKIAGFFQKVEQRLNISRSMIFDYYEVPVLGYALFHCPFHRYHLPGFFEIIIRDPMTLAPLAGTDIGAIQFISAFDETAPNHSILTNDLGYVYEEFCPCGLESKILQFKNASRTTRLYTSLVPAVARSGVPS